MHASLWPMLIVVTIVYIIDGIKAPRLHLQGYKIKPIIIVGVLMIVAGFLNPYSIKMLLLMFSSYGNTRFMELVVELKPFDLRNLLKILTYFAIVVAIVLQIFGNRRWIRIRYLLMFFGFLALGLNSIKGLSQFILVMFLPVASMYRDAIIKLIEVIDLKDYILIIQELFIGISLGQYHKKYWNTEDLNKKKEKVYKIILTQIFSAMNYLHNNGQYINKR